MHRPDTNHPTARTAGAAADPIPAAGDPTGRVRVAAIVSGYHDDITGVMLASARACLDARLGERGSLEVIPAAGAFEIPTLAAAVLATGRFDAIVTLGCIIKGQTEHDRVIADAIAAEIARQSAATRVPIGFGVLTVLNLQQARARVDGSHGDKGAETMNAALDTLAVIQQLQQTPSTEPGATTP